MKLMGIKAVENRKEREVYLNPTQVESIEAHEGMNLVVTASGRWIYTEIPFDALYTAWMLALNPEMEIAYNAGANMAKAIYTAQAQQAQQAQDVQEEGGQEG